MGKKSNAKKARAKETEKPKQVMDPVLMQAFTRGRDAGYKSGKVDGIGDMMMMFSEWTEEIDQHVKGVGPATKDLIVQYFFERIQSTINKNKDVNTK